MTTETERLHFPASPLPSLNYITEHRFFEHEEALGLIPLLNFITAKTKKEINNLNGQLNYFKNNQEKKTEIQKKLDHSLQSWSEKIKRLGCIPEIFPKVKIPQMKGYYLWEYPEIKLFLE